MPFSSASLSARRLLLKPRCFDMCQSARPSCSRATCSHAARARASMGFAAKTALRASASDGSRPNPIRSWRSRSLAPGFDPASALRRAAFCGQRHSTPLTVDPYRSGRSSPQSFQETPAANLRSGDRRPSQGSLFLSRKRNDARLIDPAAQSHRLHQAITRSRLSLVPGCGQWCVKPVRMGDGNDKGCLGSRGADRIIDKRPGRSYMSLIDICLPSYDFCAFGTAL